MKRKIFVGIGVLVCCFLITTLVWLYRYFRVDFDYHVYTITEKTNSRLVNISYPHTYFSKLNKKIEDYIETERNFFEKNSISLSDPVELDIHYRYQVLNERFISITLITYMNHFEWPNPIHEVQTFFYDAKKRNFLKLNDLVNLDELEKIMMITKNSLEQQCLECVQFDLLELSFPYLFSSDNVFAFDQEFFYLYLNPSILASDYQEVITIPIEISKLSFLVSVF